MADLETLQKALGELSAKEQAMKPERSRLRDKYQRAKEAYQDYSKRLKVIRDARAEVEKRVEEAGKKPRKVAEGVDALIQSVTAAASGGAETPD